MRRAPARALYGGPGWEPALDPLAQPPFPPPPPPPPLARALQESCNEKGGVQTPLLAERPSLSVRKTQKIVVLTAARDSANTSKTLKWRYVAEDGVITPKGRSWPARNVSPANSPPRAWREPNLLIGLELTLFRQVLPGVWIARVADSVPVASSVSGSTQGLCTASLPRSLPRSQARVARAAGNPDAGSESLRAALPECTDTASPGRGSR